MFFFHTNFHINLMCCLQAQHVLNPLDLLAPGTSLELQDSRDATAAWAVVIEDNVGGRLRLRYHGTEALPDGDATLWLFYLCPLLHLPGWAQKSGCTLRPPTGECLISASHHITCWMDEGQGPESKGAVINSVNIEWFELEPLCVCVCFQHCSLCAPRRSGTRSNKQSALCHRIQPSQRSSRRLALAVIHPFPLMCLELCTHFMEEVDPFSPSHVIVCKVLSISFSFKKNTSFKPCQQLTYKCI